jgi:hypothetical protein
LGFFGVTKGYTFQVYITGKTAKNSLVFSFENIKNNKGKNGVK